MLLINYNYLNILILLRKNNNTIQPLNLFFKFFIIYIYRERRSMSYIFTIASKEIPTTPLAASINSAAFSLDT